VTVDGQGSSLDFDSRSRSTDAGDAGDLRIVSRQLLVQNGAKVSARTSGAGNAGTLEVKAESVTVDGSGSGLTFDTRGTGNARGIKIETGQLVVQNGGQITVSGTSSGNPGDLEVIAGSIFLSGKGRLTTETASGEGGNIRLRVQDEIRMRYNSLISASAKGNGNGGNVEVEIPNGFILAFLSENSDIIASAEQGNGGVARATAGGVFGFRQFIDQPTPESDFTATSELGIDGTTEIITPNRRLEELPGNVTNAEIAQGCEAVRGQEPNRFVVTGRGGLPPNPKEALSKDAVQVDWVTLNPEGENRSSSAVATPVTSATPAPLIEAQGWVMNDKGQVVLTASAPTVTPHSPWQKPTSCRASQSVTRS
jgi:large exoprotein involved in heme utilization and adhesion